MDLLYWMDVREWRRIAGPSAFFIAAIALLTYDHVQAQRDELIYWSALVLVVAVFVWLMARVGRASQLIAEETRTKFVDGVTGLGSDEALRRDVAVVLGEGTSTVLVAIDLGTPPQEEGADQTERLIRAAAELVENWSALSASTYRVRGTLFAGLIPINGMDPASTIAQARAALGRAHPSALANACSGQAVLPDEAATAEAAWHLVSERLAVGRQNGAGSPRRQAHAALIAALSARRPQLRKHLRTVVPRVISVGRRMGLDPQSLDDIVLAAGLQDIGMLSVPESILEKRSSLTSEERTELRGHPVVGEQIVGSATSLTDVAGLVRSSYERFDGSGYPDGLAGHEIPLGARIIAPCVALAAMTANRPHRPGLNPAEAAAELRAGSGSQFDPRVVAALLSEEFEGAERAPRLPEPPPPGVPRASRPALVPQA